MGFAPSRKSHGASRAFRTRQTTPSATLAVSNTLLKRGIINKALTKPFELLAFRASLPLTSGQRDCNGDHGSKKSFAYLLLSHPNLACLKHSQVRECNPTRNKRAGIDHLNKSIAAPSLASHPTKKSLHLIEKFVAYRSASCIVGNMSKFRMHIKYSPALAGQTPRWGGVPLFLH